MRREEKMQRGGGAVLVRKGETEKAQDFRDNQRMGKRKEMGGKG